MEMTNLRFCPVSVLISTYAGERADRLNAALASIAAQTLPPREVVIVYDGVVGADQECVVRQVAENHAEIDWRIVRLTSNVGLGPALNAGLAECRMPYVARMDSDDFSYADRLEEQWTFLEGHREVDLLSGWQDEFDDDSRRVVRTKRTPETHDAIVRQLVWHCVVSHPTIMFRREAVSGIGGYWSFRHLEDHDLFLRLIARGGRLHALQRPLVKVRTSPEQYARRGGAAHVRAEFRLRWDGYRRSNLTFIEFAASLGAISVFRLMPTRLRRASYRFVRTPSQVPRPLPVRFGAVAKKWLRCLTERAAHPIRRVIAPIRGPLDLWAWRRAGRPAPPPPAFKQRVVRAYARRHGLTTLIETGTYRGDMVETQRRWFGRIISIELSHDLYRSAVRRFSNARNVTILEGDGGALLPQVLADRQEPCLFWLDGHNSAGVTARGDLDTPILKEFDAILTRPWPDVVLVDDARCFGQGDYPSIDRIRAIVANRRPTWSLRVADDIIRVHGPARQRPSE